MGEVRVVEGEKKEEQRLFLLLGCGCVAVVVGSRGMNDPEEAECGSDVVPSWSAPGCLSGGGGSE